MIKLNRQVILDTLIQHETLTIHDLAKTEIIGSLPNRDHLFFLLDELSESGYVKRLEGVIPFTYTITENGINEGVRLKNMEELSFKQSKDLFHKQTN